MESPELSSANRAGSPDGAGNRSLQVVPKNRESSNSYTNRAADALIFDAPGCKSPESGGRLATAQTVPSSKLNSTPLHFHSSRPQLALAANNAKITASPGLHSSMFADQRLPSPAEESEQVGSLNKITQVSTRCTECGPCFDCSPSLIRTKRTRPLAVSSRDRGSTQGR